MENIVHNCMNVTQNLIVANGICSGLSVTIGQ